jgi:hypothetical protein
LEKLSWKGHRYLSLALLMLVWIFFLSGLLLNHGNWPISQFWPSRQTTHLQQAITAPAGKAGLAAAEDLMAQLGLSGEPDNITARGGGDSLTFSVVRPGKIVRVDADLRAGVAAVETNRTNLVGATILLHTFTGVRALQPESSRDWSLTKAWSAAIDILSGGLLLIVFSGLYITFRRGEDLTARIAFLGLGILVCLFFLFGLQWIY